MPYLIDGHNLIPKISGMSLSNLDDEQKLIDVLQRFSRVRRQRIEVFFDQAPAGQAKSRQFGLVKAHYVSKSSSADEAIRLRLGRIGRESPNWKVVTSDRQVQAEARSHGAEVISSEEFSILLFESNRPALADGEKGDPESSPTEVEEWLGLFERRKKKK